MFLGCVAESRHFPIFLRHQRRIFPVRLAKLQNEMGFLDLRWISGMHRPLFWQTSEKSVSIWLATPRETPQIKKKKGYTQRHVVRRYQEKEGGLHRRMFFLFFFHLKLLLYKPFANENWHVSKPVHHTIRNGHYGTEKKAKERRKMRLYYFWSPFHSHELNLTLLWNFFNFKNTLQVWLPTVWTTPIYSFNVPLRTI